MQEPPAALAMAGGSFPDGGEGRRKARNDWERLSALCHLACQAEKVSSLVLDRWNAIVLGSWWSCGRGAAALARARSMQRRMPAIETSEGHHSSWTRVDLDDATRVPYRSIYCTSHLFNVSNYSLSHRCGGKPRYSMCYPYEQVDDRGVYMLFYCRALTGT